MAGQLVRVGVCKVAGDSSIRGIAGSGRVNRPVRVRLPATGCRMNSHETPSVRAR
ncbi:MAG: IS element ISTsi2 orfB, probably Transposase [Thermococcus sibiricus]|uniref:IS element ISTsi2 orfB, probably Transposase n=1 Tax=Thermococcus sibiricus TaxID=172049 RepID=A0A101EKP6_9EURY|nr:MAG: IS element ISTsi2 orfB, probably Transposase [Thermococcus sibiricus]